TRTRSSSSCARYWDSGSPAGASTPSSQPDVRPVRPGEGWGLKLGTFAPVALFNWTLNAVTPGAGMAQTPPYQVTDPATGEVTETFPFATDTEVAEALAAATEAFAVWRLRPVAERAAIVKRIAELFTERAADLAALITKEMGKRRAKAVGGGDR